MGTRIIELVEQYVERCFAARTSPRVDELASMIGESRLAVTRRFAREQGTALGRFLRLRQVEHAATLLRETELPLVDVAAASGFTCMRSFFRSFRRVKQLSPASWRRRFHDVAP